MIKEFHVKKQLHRNKVNACQQPYHPKCTSFREITEVKQLFSISMGDHISSESTVYVLLAKRIYNPITLMGFSAMLTFQWDNTKR